MANLPGTQLDLSRFVNEVVGGSFRVDSLIGHGGSGATFLANHVKMGGKSAIKFFRPSPEGTEESLAEARKVSKIQDHAFIARVTDLGSHPMTISGGTVLQIPYLVSDFVDGETLESFLERSTNVPAKFVVQFAKQVCFAIKELHGAGIEHGDLHGRNIMLVKPRPYEPQGAMEFSRVKLVDFGMARSFNAQTGTGTDLKQLAVLLREIWLKTLTYEGRPIGAEKKFSAAIPELIKELNETEPALRIVDPMRFVSRIDTVVASVETRQPEPLTKLTSPFEYISVEQIPEDSPLLSTLFTSAPWFQEVKEFGNVLLTGPRGCGKSMVLKNMRLRTWLESAEELEAKLSAERYVGFYLHCHPTIYIPFSERYVEHDPNSSDALLHYMNLLMAHEVISTLSRAVRKGVVSIPSQPRQALAALVLGMLSSPPSILHEDEYLETLADLLDREARHIAHDLRSNKPVKAKSALSLYLELGKAIRQIPLFSRCRVYYLLDDYSDSNVKREMQRSFNRLLRHRNDLYCFKITAEKFSVEMEDMDANKIQTPHDLKVIDLGEKYLSEPSSKAQRQFIARIINERLDAAGKDKSIQAILGRRSMAVKNLVALLADPKKHNEARYSGWETLYMLCSGDIRTILELCREIIETAEARGIQAYSGTPIPVELQHEVIREASRRYLMDVKTAPMGDRLFRIATAFGEISQKYLRESGPIGRDPKGKRFYEILRIDIDSIVGMTGEAQSLYEQLLRQAVFVEQGGAFREGATTRLIFRRIFAPNFQMSYHNKESLRLSLARFEKFVTAPEDFQKTGTDLLRESVTLGVTLESFWEEE